MNELVDFVFEKYKEHLNLKISNAVVIPENWINQSLKSYPKLLTIELSARDLFGCPVFKIDYLNGDNQEDVTSALKSCLASFLYFYGENWEDKIKDYFKEVVYVF